MVNSTSIETDPVPSLPEQVHHTRQPIQETSTLLNQALSSNTVRQKYNLILKLYKKLEKISSKAIYLEECLQDNLIPNTFKIKNKLFPTHTKMKIQINNLLLNTSTKLIKIIIEDLKLEENDIFKQHLDAINDLLNSTVNKNYKQILLDQLTVMESKFRELQRQRREKRKSWLQKHTNQTNNKPTIPTPDDTNHKKTEPKRKKHRRFVKKK